MQKQRNKLNFEGQNIHTGLDVHKTSWTVCIMTKELEHKRFNQKPSAGELARYLERNFPGGTYCSAHEAGFCGFHAHLELLKHNIHNIIVNAADVPTTHKEKVQKDDRRDSRKIARGLRNGELEAIYVPLRKTMEDRMLYRARIVLVKDLRRCRQRIKAMLNFSGIEQPFIFNAPGTHWSGRYMDWLDGIKMEHDTGDYALKMLTGEVKELRKRLLDTNKKLRKLSCSEACKDDYKLIGSIPGIALITGMTFLTEIEDINRFPGTDRFAAYVGLVPSCHSTGEHEHAGGITPRGQKQLRGMIIESAWIAAKIDPALHLVFCNLCKRMESNKAIVRIAGKLLNRIYYTLKNKTEYVCGVLE